VRIGYDGATRQVFVDRTRSGETTFSPQFAARTAAPLPEGGADGIDFDILVDRNSIEVFAGDGAVAMTNLVFPKSRWDKVSFFSSGGARQTSMKIRRLESAH
jgi:levanase